MTDNLLISVAKGELPADLILANARIVNVFTGEIESDNVAIWGGRIAGVGDYQRAKEVLDLGGRYLAPGFIDGHTHLESSMLDVAQYARAVVPRGTLGVVTDLHEIANVCGLEGMNFPGVLSSDKSLLSKIALALGKAVDGHAPGVSGKNLSAYIAAGIHSDHESVSLHEAREKLRQGMFVMIREGSTEKNLDALLPLVTDKTYNRCFPYSRYAQGG